MTNGPMNPTTSGEALPCAGGLWCDFDPTFHVDHIHTTSNFSFLLTIAIRQKDRIQYIPSGSILTSKSSNMNHRIPVSETRSRPKDRQSINHDPRAIIVSFRGRVKKSNVGGPSSGCKSHPISRGVGITSHVMTKREINPTWVFCDDNLEDEKMD